MSDPQTHKAPPDVAHVPVELLQHLSRMAAEMGNPALQRAVDELPGVARFAPTVDLSRPIHSLALELGRLIARAKSAKGKYAFVKETGEYVTVDEATGEIEALGAGRFVGFVENFCAFKSSGRSNRLREGLTREDAALVLEQDVFRDCLRRLTRVHTMRLPVMRERWEKPEGEDAPAVLRRFVEWLEPGYDEETGIFTCDLVPYEHDWTVERAVEWFLDVCGEVPWNGKEECPDLRKNRSFAVHVAMTVGNYCHSLFPAGTLRPMAGYFANKPGTGKTRMAEASLSHVHGFVGATTAPKDEDKMDVKLETVARAMRPFVIFDDIGGALRSNALNKFLTETRHTGRCYNSNSEFFDVPNVTQVLVTANDLPTSEDLGRRALIAELFLAEEVRGRKFKRTITPGWLAEKGTRASFLAACCALVKHWASGAGCDVPMVMHPRPLETFELWTGSIGAMVVNAGLADPLAAPEMDVGGASQEDEIKTLLRKIAQERLAFVAKKREDGEDVEEDAVITRAELVQTAREYGLLEKLLGAKGDDAPDNNALKSLGRRMERWRGQRLATEEGRRFQFSHKKNKSGASYPLTFLK